MRKEQVILDVLQTAVPIPDTEKFLSRLRTIMDHAGVETEGASMVSRGDRKETDMPTDVIPKRSERSISSHKPYRSKWGWAALTVAVMLGSLTGFWVSQGKMANQLPTADEIILDPETPPRMGVDSVSEGNLIVWAEGVTLRDVIAWAYMQELGVERMVNRAAGRHPIRSGRLQERQRLSQNEYIDRIGGDYAAVLKSDPTKVAEAAGYTFRKYISSLPDVVLGISIPPGLSGQVISFRSAPISIKEHEVKLNPSGTNSIIAWSEPVYRQLERKFDLKIERRGKALTVRPK